MDWKWKPETGISKQFHRVQEMASLYKMQIQKPPTIQCYFLLQDISIDKEFLAIQNHEDSNIVGCNSSVRYSQNVISCGTQKSWPKWAWVAFLLLCVGGGGGAKVIHRNAHHFIVIVMPVLIAFLFTPAFISCFLIYCSKHEWIKSSRSIIQTCKGAQFQTFKGAKF